MGFFPQPKPASRLEDRLSEDRLRVIDERAFKRDVWTRDRDRCRWCGRRVSHTLEHVAWRGEVHHLHGRTGDLRFESRCAILLCLEHHELVTGKVNQRWIVVGTVFWRLHEATVIEAKEPLRFERIA